MQITLPPLPPEGLQGCLFLFSGPVGTKPKHSRKPRVVGLIKGEAMTSLFSLFMKT